MATKRVVQSSINWASIAERVPSDQKALYLAFKSKSDNYLRKVLALPENPPKIDWGYYKSKVPNPAMVDEFQKKYEAFKIPVPQDTVSSSIEVEEKKAAEVVKQFKAESVSRIAEHEEQLKKYAAMIPLTEMTMEDYAYYFPEDAHNPLEKPTFWPHDDEEQPWYEEDKNAQPQGGH